MARTQTMVQLTDELMKELDREAERTGESRSAIIRNAISAYLDERAHVVDVRRYVEGYQTNQPSTPDEWGDLVVRADAHFPAHSDHSGENAPGLQRPDVRSRLRTG